MKKRSQKYKEDKKKRGKYFGGVPYVDVIRDDISQTILNFGRYIGASVELDELAFKTNSNLK
jgi:hypothetical protein